MQTRFVYGCAFALLVTSLPAIAGDNVTVSPAPVKKANYELAAQWTSSKIAKMIFDVAVTPHWLDSGDRFWYTFETTQGRKFWMVDPAKKTRSLVFDPVKLAAQLTTATGLPYDSQHLPISTIRFVKNDTTIEFDVNVPRDAVIPGEKKPPAGALGTDALGNGNGDEEDPQQQGGRGGRGAIAGPNQKTLYFE